jgi:hypothetical protein
MSAKTAFRLFEHALAMDVGILMMVVGLVMGLSVVLLPFGLVIGVVGFVIFNGAFVGKIDKAR